MKKSNYKESDLERKFDFYLKLLVPYLADTMVKEHRFHPVRKWRFDRAWPEYKIAVACEGGLFRKAGGAHRSVQGVLRDIEKTNAAVEAGWRVLRVTVKMLDSDPEAFFSLLERVFTIQLGPELVYPGNCPDTPQERAAIVGWIMALGQPISINKVARLANLSSRATLNLLKRLCRVLPIHEPSPGSWCGMHGKKKP